MNGGPSPERRWRVGVIKRCYNNKRLQMGVYKIEEDIKTCPETVEKVGRDGNRMKLLSICEGV